jgi:undecaprenyl-diphosphatase
MGEREEPIILQWSGTPDELAAALRPHGWRPAVDLGIVSAGAYLRGDTVPEALPVLPRLNDGRAPVLSLVRPTPRGRDVLNLWKSNVHLVDRRGEPLLVGAVISESVAHPLPFLTIPTGLRPADADVVGQLRNELPNVQSVVRPAPAQTAEPPAALLLAGP